LERGRLQVRIGSDQARARMMPSRPLRRAL